jgi:hypothetical protein
MHLGGNHDSSTFRRTLGAVLAQTKGADHVDEPSLTRWMHDHLRVVAVPYGDPDTLGHVERAILDQLDPPLNLQAMAPTPLRRRLTELRRDVAQR